MTDEQESIASGKVTRVAALAGAGAKVGINYLKHYGRHAVGSGREINDLHEANARTVYDTFSKLKGGPLKMAQMLSIDKNMLPDAYRAQFAQAQYSAPTLSYPLVVRTFRRDLGKDPTDVFDTFSQSAMHGASIGQVHRATIGAQTFAVKVQYPGVADSLSSDLAVVKPVALQMLGLKEKEVEPYFLEVKERLLEETDYRKELENSIALSEKTQGIAGIRFPRYYPEYSSDRVITMDWIEGKTLDKYAASETRQEEKNAVSQAIWDFYHFQIHTLKQFHADPHPGNFLVTEENEVVVLDFGCTKQIKDEFHRDYFEFLNPEILTDRERFETGLRKLELLTDADSERHRRIIIENAMIGAELLGRPFAEGHFDFGNADYMASIFELGDAQQRNKDLKEIRSARGSVDSIYLNRAYFGLYSLMGALKAQITTNRQIY